jgi:hypothetical protein
MKLISLISSLILYHYIIKNVYLMLTRLPVGMYLV